MNHLGKISNQLFKALESAALSDLDLARKEGCITVAGTHAGNVQVEYLPEQRRIYRLTDFNTGKLITSGKKSVIKTALMKLYVVEGE